MEDADALPAELAEGIVLHAMAPGPLGAAEARHEPGFVDDGFVEYYGIEAGPRVLYLQRGTRVSGLLRVEVPGHAIREIAFPALHEQTSRTLRLESPESATAIATLMLQYEDFALLRPWRGQPIDLRSPLHRPSRIVVRAPGPQATRTRLGLTHDVAGGAGDIDIILPVGDNTLVLTADAEEPAAAPNQDYVVSLTAGLQVVDEAETRPHQHVLAALRQAEFDLPPRTHTWIAGDLAQSLTVEGTGSESMWVGVGVSRRGRYMLWRQQEAGTERVRRSPASASPAELPTAGLVLPRWIRTVGLASPLDPGPRNEHRSGPSQIWEESTAGDTTWRRIAAWINGTGKRREVANASVRVPWPPLEPTDSIRLSVRVPHPVRGDGSRFFYTHRGNTRPDLPSMPDGLLDGVVSRRGRTALVLRGVISRGRLLDPAVAWQNTAAGTTETDPVEVRVTDAMNAPLSGVKLFGEDGKLAAETDSSGSLRLPRGASPRNPPLVSLHRPGRGFSHHSYATQAPYRVRLSPPAGLELSWSDVEPLLGVDLQSVGIHSIHVGKQPSGESAQLLRDRTAVLQTSDLLEFAGHGPGSEVWGWFDREAAAVATGPTVARALDTPPRAEVLLLNRSVRRTIHISLPRTELRLGVGTGRQRRLQVAAPVRLSVLSVVTASRDVNELLIDEGVTAELLPGDVLVVTYDDAQ